MSVARVMDVRYGRRDLSEEGPRLALAESVAVHDVVEKLAAGAVLEDHEDLLLVLQHLEQLADVLVGEHLHRGDLEADAGQVLAELLLVHDLDRHLLPRRQVGGKFDLKIKNSF